MGKKLDKYISMLQYVKQLEDVLTRRIKEGNYDIEFEWTSDGVNELVSRDLRLKGNIEPDGSQTFTFKFGRGS